MNAILHHHMFRIQRIVRNQTMPFVEHRRVWLTLFDFSYMRRALIMFCTGLDWNTTFQSVRILNESWLDWNTTFQRVRIQRIVRNQTMPFIEHRRIWLTLFDFNYMRWALIMCCTGLDWNTTFQHVRILTESWLDWNTTFQRVRIQRIVRNQTMPFIEHRRVWLTLFDFNYMRRALIMCCTGLDWNTTFQRVKIFCDSVTTVA